MAASPIMRTLSKLSRSQIVEHNDASAVGDLKCKVWFDWDDDAKLLLPGTKLIFRVQTEIPHKNKTMHSFFSEFRRQGLCSRSAHYTSGVSVGNPVTAYLHVAQRRR